MIARTGGIPENGEQCPTQYSNDDSKIPTFSKVLQLNSADRGAKPTRLMRVADAASPAYMPRTQNRRSIGD